MYKANIEKFGSLERLTIFDNRGNSFSVIPGYGANLNELKLNCNGNSYSVIDGVMSYEQMVDDKAYKSSVLLPWPNRIKDGKYSFEGKEYQVEVNETSLNNALHGFIYKKPFVVEDTILKEDSAEVKLSYSYDGSERGYPFQFKSILVYKISDQEGFSVDVIVVNNDNKKIPLGFGWHPYFSLPSGVNELLLQLPKCQIYEIDQQMIPTGAKTDYDLFASARVVEETVFDSCLGLVGDEKRSVTTLIDPAKGISLDFWQDRGQNGFDFLQVYTPPTRKTIALEPMTCGVDVFNNANGLLLLQPGNEFKGSFGVRLKRA